MSDEKRPPGAPKAWGRKTLCVLLGLVGIVALATSVTMGVLFNSGLMSSEEAKLVQGVSSATVHVFVALFAMAAGVAWANRKSKWGGLGAASIFVVTAVFGIYAVTCVVGFGATERIGTAMIAEAQQAANSKAVADANVTAKQDKARQLEWLQATYKAARKQSERDALLAQMSAKSSEAVAVQADKVKVVLGDMQAHVLARVATGGSDKQAVENVQLLMTTVLAVLLIVGEMMSLSLATALWPRGDGPSTQTAGNAQAEPAPSATAEPEKKATVEPDRVPFRPRVIDGSAKAQTIASKKERRERERKTVSDFLNAAEASASVGAKASADQVYRWFQDWSQALGIQVISQTRFGTLAGELGADRQSDGRYVQYYGVARPAFALTEKIAA